MVCIVVVYIISTRNNLLSYMLLILMDFGFELSFSRDLTITLLIFLHAPPSKPTHTFISNVSFRDTLRIFYTKEYLIFL